MEPLKHIFGYIAISAGALAYFIYIRGILKNHTKPHAFSWLLWTLTTAITFSAQVLKGGGAGSWATGFTCVVCLAIGIISFFKYDKAYTLTDMVFIGIALLSLIPWFLTKDPTTSAVIIAIVDVVGYAPTLRKSYLYPAEEKAASFALNSFKHSVTLLAMQSYVIATCVYPISQIFMNGLVVVILLQRRRKTHP